jgi:hypothetical protein
VKLILSPNLHGLKARRRAGQKSLGDARETLLRARHIKVFEMIAQTTFARTLFEQTPFRRVGRVNEMFLCGKPSWGAR